MYKLINTNGGAVIGTTESPRFIYKKSTGCFVETNEANAQGVAYKGAAYNLFGREGVGVDGTVMLVEYDAGETVDAATELTAQQAQDRADIEYIAMEAGIDLES